MPIVVLLASYQGADFIAAQLASIAAQDFVTWSLLVSDDGSRDGTREIVTAFAATQPEGRVRLLDGPRLGATQNFLHLIEAAPAGAALAFCDQDDVWFPDKLARAARALAGGGEIRANEDARPVHYAARTVITDPDLRPVAGSRRFARPFGFRNALVQACMAGNTSVFNPAASALLKAGAASARDAGIQSHDWWAYQLTSGAGARLIHDPQPALYYRQHRQSEMGRNDTAGAMAKRLGKLFAGDYGGWVGANLAALQATRELLTPESGALLDAFTEALTRPGPRAAARMRGLGLYRHSRAGTAALFAAAAAGRLRQPRSPSNLSR